MKTAVTQTAEDYAGRSSIHGIGYVFDRELFSEHIHYTHICIWYLYIWYIYIWYNSFAMYLIKFQLESLSQGAWCCWSFPVAACGADSHRKCCCSDPELLDSVERWTGVQFRSYINLSTSDTSIVPYSDCVSVSLSGGDGLEGHCQADHGGSLPRPHHLRLWTVHERRGEEVDQGLQGMASREQQERDNQGGNRQGCRRLHAE